MTALFSKQPPAKPELWAFWMRTFEFVGNSIAAITGGLWSHMGILVYLPDGSAWVYEALFAEGKIVKQDARKRFATFIASDYRNQLCVVPVTWATDAAIASALEYAESCVKDVIYARWQLLAMLAAQRYGLPVPRSTTKQVCSEFGSRFFGGGDCETAVPRICDLRDVRCKTYDEVTPESAFRRMMAIVAGYGDFTHNPPIQNHPAFTY